MTNKIPNTKYDLSERTAVFGENIIAFTKAIQLTDITKPLIHQIVRSGTSIGANYMEADAGESKKDFEHKIAICRKEAKETMFWLRMIAAAFPPKKIESRTLWKEAQEFVFIFSTILKNSKNKALLQKLED